ncbi:MAG TPA: glycine betaine ABC transporter substrate-binding protein [Virgibacillus sp.]|nr:glycine betaine ABC transporter substrate-binding protein [Virgibacillus sp.]
MKKQLGIMVAIIVMLMMTACGSDDSDAEENETIGEKLDYKITGIDPGAGLMDLAQDEVLPAYDLDDDWEITESSDTAMTAELQDAIDNEEPIIVTAWIPHWKFNRFDLKMLDDPEGAFKGKEDINTIVRLGLEEDMPNAYKFFDQFEWEPDDMQDVMLKIEEGMDEQEAAEEWVEDNEDLVDEWIDGVDSGEGQEVTIPYVAWDDVVASTNVVGYVLENKLDFETDLLLVEPGPMFASIAEGDSDAMVGAWLPTTHKAYYEEYEDDFEDLGVNLHGTQNGFAVPEYMDIDSIEDLQE